MNQGSQTANQTAKTSNATQRWVILASLFMAAAGYPGQAQQGSLADAARQARAQKQPSPQAASRQAQQVADQLSEEQNSGDAPAGFKTYNAGDYKVWVPAPYTVDGRDDGGIVLSGPNLGSKHSVVLLGTPIVFRWGGSDTAFHDAAVQFASMYLMSAKCAKTMVASHEAFQCGLAGATLMGHMVSGNAMFVHVADRIYPIFCTAPTDSNQRDIINDPRASYDNKFYARKALDREEQDVRAVWQKCDRVFQSIRVQEGRAAQSGPASSVSSASATSVPGTASPAGAGETANAGGPGSLADVARRLKQDPAQAAVVSAPAAESAPAASTVPAGFKVHAFQYCAAPRTCWNASVLVPVDAKLISSECKQYAFEIKVQGNPFVLMAGSAGEPCDAGRGPDLVRWHQLIDPENQRAPGTYATISSQVTKVDEKPATITTLAFRKGLTDWMGKRAEMENNGGEVVVGCMAPRDHFADGDAICSALIGSIRLP